MGALTGSKPILPILNGDGIPLFEKLYRDVALHLAELKAYKSGTVALRYEVRGVAALAGEKLFVTQRRISFDIYFLEF
jgi:hypothetical protein